MNGRDGICGHGGSGGRLVVLVIIAVGFVIRRRRARRANQTRVESALRARTFDRCGGMLSATGTSSWRPPAPCSPSGAGGPGKNHSGAPASSTSKKRKRASGWLAA